MTKQRVLVTNDDGIDGPGLRALVPALVDAGYELIVIAPDSDYSGAGTSIISNTDTTFSEGQREIAYERRVLEEAPEVEAYAIAAPPAMCTLLSMRGAFGERPDLVASGINFGLNAGPAVRHSGTVSAALTASAGFGVPSLAVSAQYTFDEPDLPMHFETAAAVAVKLMPLLATGTHKLLNLNVPQLPISELKGIRSGPVSSVTGFYSFVEERTDDRLKIGYRIGEDPVPADSDSGLVRSGYAAISSLIGYTSVDCSDLIAQLNEAAA